MKAIITPRKKKKKMTKKTDIIKGERIIISPYSTKLTSGKTNPKNYPYWEELIDLLKKSSSFLFTTVTQIGVGDEVKLKNADEYWWDLPLKELEKRVEERNTFFISVDNFFPHLAHYKNKKGVVIWGYSDPDIFGYSENMNIVDRFHLRKWQFQTWNEVNFNAAIFPKPEIVLSGIEIFLTS